MNDLTKWWDVDILFANDEVRDWCLNEKFARRKLGPEQAKKLRQRLDDLRAAPNLETMRTLPGRTHELTGDRKGEISIDLKHPYRLLFEAANDPTPSKPDGGLDWGRVTAINILSIEDTHE